LEKSDQPTKKPFIIFGGTKNFFEAIFHRLMIIDFILHISLYITVICVFFNFQNKRYG